MDPLRIAVRVAFAYLVMLALVRCGGKRAVTQGSVFDFAVALILGDMFDDLIWAEIAASQFVVASSVMIMAHVLVDTARFRTGTRA